MIYAIGANMDYKLNFANNDFWFTIFQPAIGEIPWSKFC